MFLDISMPAINGIDFLKMLRNPPKVIVTTAYRQYALDGYDLDIIDYLLKPITFDRFFKSIERYLRNADQRIQLTAKAPSETESIFLKSGYRNVKINMDDILYMESLKDYVKIYTLSRLLLSTRSVIWKMSFQLKTFYVFTAHLSST